MEVKKITMEEVEVAHHDHPLIPFTRFFFRQCRGCKVYDSDPANYIYGGYCCNEVGCEAVFHKECVKPLPEIHHSSHPDHLLKLIYPSLKPFSLRCTLCDNCIRDGYFCTICDFKLDMRCARIPLPLAIPQNSYGHEHPLQLSLEPLSRRTGLLNNNCKVCDSHIYDFKTSCYYNCHQCEYFIHLECFNIGPEAYHNSHPQHPLKSIECRSAPNYLDKKCLLCAEEFDKKLHHCNVCNFSICRACMKNPPPIDVASPTTHEHELHLVPRRINFTCNACGTLGDRSPYFCLQCNFMIHRECIDLPRVININRQVHRITYTPRLGHGEWINCGVCRKKVDEFYGAYYCSKCSSYVVHSRCATKKDVWDMVELEGTPEEEEIAPFEVIDYNTIRHFSHDHNLRINKDGMILHESITCVACVFQILSAPFYSCEKCDFILHEKCANLPLKKRHVCDNQPFTLQTDSRHISFRCVLCEQYVTGFRYESDTRKRLTLDVGCGSMTDSFLHESHPHPLYYSPGDSKPCNRCGNRGNFCCDECDFSLDYKCALLPQQVMRHRYDDHPLSLSYGESSVDGEYWCEACETKLNPKEWFYTCNDCGVVLHITCVLGDFSYVMPGSAVISNAKVIANTSICRPLCSVCKSLCKLPSVLSNSEAGMFYFYYCSDVCCEYLKHCQMKIF